MYVLVTGPPAAGKSSLSRVLEARFARRADQRRPGHFDEERTTEELWNPQSLRPLNGGWPVLDVRTDEPLDIDAWAELFRRTADESATRLE